MTEHDHQHEGGQGHETPHRRGPDWRRVHHHRYFWVGVCLMLVAMGIYVMTEDLSWRPHSHLQHRPSNAAVR